MSEEQQVAFDCAICGRHVDFRWPGAKQSWHIDPLCRYCETTWGPRQKPHGSFKDRRMAVQISALANALESEARAAHYRRYGYAAP